MRRTSLKVTAMFLLGLAAGAGYLFASHAWICSGTTAYHWGRRTVGYASPVAQTTVSRSATAYTSAFNKTIPTWDSTVINLFGGGTQLRLYYGAYGTTGWLGLATISNISNCVIGSAKSQLNDSYLRSSSYSQTNIDHVACQEVGHTFGLNHNRNATDTCMNDTILSAGNRINSHDYNQLSSIYANIPN
jgi:predicted Zn-dependent protease